MSDVSLKEKWKAEGRIEAWRSARDAIALFSENAGFGPLEIGEADIHRLALNALVRAVQRAERHRIAHLLGLL